MNEITTTNRFPEYFADGKTRSLTAAGCSAASGNGNGNGNTA